jgi:mRNA-degrading endonuclease RelE of RelBE toxin-antitoxin system
LKLPLSEAAEAVYERFYKRAAEARDRGEVTSYHYTALNMIDEVLEQIIPRDPFNKRYALQGNLSGIFRMQKGRLRIAWVGNSEKREVCVIFISETLRKEGDSKDPYKLLTAMLLSGECDEVFVGLGLPPPSKFPRSNTGATLQ